MNLCLPIGTSPIWGFTCTDPDNAGAAINITGATFVFYVKAVASDADADAIFSLTSADSEIVIITAASGTAQILNETAKTALLTIGTVYYWSLRVTFTSGENRVIRNGKLFAEAP
jgi:Na+/melibiose symporter-like transporter